MRLFSYYLKDAIRCGVVISGRGFDLALVERAATGATSDAELNRRLSGPLPNAVSMLELLRSGQQRAEQLCNSVGRVHRTARAEDGFDLAGVKFALPVTGSQKILCVGRNYLAHIHESGRERPNYPVIFTRFEDTLVPHAQAIVRPKASSQLDWEGELAVVMGKHCRRVTAAQAWDAVAGYTVMNEGSVRDYQHRTPQWTAGKNFPQSGACGPYVVTADKVPDAANLNIVTTVNGQVVQNSNTSRMLFKIPEIISYISEWTTLAPGDVIATGTPEGIGAARKPQWFLRAGDVCNVAIECVGELSNPVVDEV